MSEQRTTFERLCRNHARRAYYNSPQEEVDQDGAECYANLHWPAYAGEVREDLAELREPDRDALVAGAYAARDGTFADGWHAVIDAIRARRMTDERTHDAAT